MPTTLSRGLLALMCAMTMRGQPVPTSVCDLLGEKTVSDGASVSVRGELYYSHGIAWLVERCKGSEASKVEENPSVMLDIQGFGASLPLAPANEAVHVIVGGTFWRATPRITVKSLEIVDRIPRGMTVCNLIKSARVLQRHTVSIRGEVIQRSGRVLLTPFQCEAAGFQNRTAALYLIDYNVGAKKRSESEGVQAVVTVTGTVTFGRRIDLSIPGFAVVGEVKVRSIDAPVIFYQGREVTR